MTAPIAFPRVAEPLVTIVTVTHGARPVVAACLAALRASTPEVYRLVIVDSASPDDTAAWLAGAVTGADVRALPRNVGYGAGSNLGAAGAATPFLLFMNPDVFPRPGWLPPLLAALAQPSVVAAGPRLLHPDGRLQAAGSLVDRTGAVHRYGDGAPDPDAPPYAYARSPDFLSGACLGVSREAFAEAGGFDPAYGLGYFEDVDLCFRFAAAGHRILYVPSSTVVHVRGASGGGETLAATVAANHRLFAARWAEVLGSRPTPEEIARPEGRIRARDARASRRILVVGDAAAGAGGILDRDPRAALTVAGREAPGLAGRAEIVAASEDWAGWFAQRRDHYDIVVGHDERLERHCRDTQPRARRVAAFPPGCPEDRPPGGTLP